MPLYRAKRRGLLGNILREEGEKFSCDKEFPEGKLPTWLELIDKRTLPPEPGKTLNGEDRETKIVKAIKEMAGEDPNRENDKLWDKKNGAPNVAELKRRTQINDITVSERNSLWMRLQVPVSGTTPVK